MEFLAKKIFYFLFIFLNVNKFNFQILSFKKYLLLIIFTFIFILIRKSQKKGAETQFMAEHYRAALASKTLF